MDEQLINEAFEEPRLEITEVSFSHLETARKWSYILSIVGLVGVGLMIIFSFAFPFLINSMGLPNQQGIPGTGISSILFGGLYLVISVIYLIPLIFLLRFSLRLKSALNQSDSLSLEQSFKFLGYFYKYIGIFTIISLVFALIYILFMAVFFSSIIAAFGSAAGV